MGLGKKHEWDFGSGSGQIAGSEPASQGGIEPLEIGGGGELLFY
jgi:hypothetical protein